MDDVASKVDAVVPSGVEDEGEAWEGFLFAVLLDDDARFGFGVLPRLRRHDDDGICCCSTLRVPR